MATNVAWPINPGFFKLLMKNIFQPDVPSAPGRPEVHGVTSHSATLSWATPPYDGGSPITNYIIEMKSSYTYTWNVVNIGQKVTSTTFTADNLIEGTTYEFRVIAENKAGRSEPSSPSIGVIVREAICEYLFELIFGLETLTSKLFDTEDHFFMMAPWNGNSFHLTQPL